MVSQEEKESLYIKSLDEIKDRIKDLGKNDMVPKMSTIVSVLKNTMPYFFWCGFYFVENPELIIGPYQGTSACPNIGYSGVCGSSANKKETVIVPNVHDFPGHIVCDPNSKSEIVIPLIDEHDLVIAVLDIDSSEENSFDDTDKDHLKKIISLLLDD